MIGKNLVIAALLSGILAFFVPFLTVKGPGPGGGQTDYTLSAMQMMQGFEGFKAAMVDKAPELENVDPAAMKGAEDLLDKLRTLVMIPFVPTAFFLLITLPGLRRFGRGLGVFSLLVGFIALGGWALLDAAMAEAGEDGKAAFEIGFTMLMVGGVLGTLGGLMGLIKPQPKSA
ncbi:MAG: hypothetical protein AAGF11_55325 [Myxococcota bacterium]